MLVQGANGQQLELPKGFDSFERFERKALKLKEHLELELDERRQVDDVVSFFIGKSSSQEGVDLLNDDQFYQPLIKMQHKEQQMESENNQMNYLQQRHQQSNQQSLNTNQSQENNYYLNQRNLSQIPQNQYQQSQTPSELRHLPSTDQESQSNYTTTNDNASSNLSKQMFANRANAMKNKKDLQAFMREKLQKTKISSETTNQIQPISQNNKNFVKKKTSVIKEDMGETKSQISEKPSQNSIYKPNLKKKDSSSAVIQKESKKDNKQDNKRRGSVMREVQCSEITNSTKQSQVKRSSSKSGIQKEQQKTQSSSIYKPQNMKPQTSKAQQRPPQVPNKQQNNKNITNNNDKTVQSSSQLSQAETQDGQEEVGQWQDQNANKDDDDDGIADIGKEEIQSQYFEGENQEEDFQKQNIHELGLDNVEVGLNYSNQTSLRKKSSQSNDDNQNQEFQNQIKSQNIDQTQRKNNICDQEEEKINQVDYGNEDGDEDQDDGGEYQDEDFYEPLRDSIKKGQIKEAIHHYNQNQSNDQQVNQKSTLQETQEEIQQENLKSQQVKHTDNLQIETSVTKPKVEIDMLNTESTTSKKIRGKVQIYVDEGALSSQQTPKIQLDKEEFDKKYNEIEQQLAVLEKQDKELKENKQSQSQKQPSKRMELIQKISNQDDTKKKQEQEERLKKVKQDLQIEKEKALLQHQKVQNITEKETQEYAQVQEQKKAEEEKKTSNASKGKKQKSQQKQQVQNIPRQHFESDQVIDYSSHYKTFYDIFVGQILEPKSFDIQYAVRDNRNMYATFVNIMDANALQMKKKVQFDQAPLEKSIQDYVVPNFFTLTGKSVNELELEFKNKSNELMLQALAQAQLKDRFNQLKQKDVNDIIKQAAEKTNQNSNNIIDVERESTLFYRVVKNRTEVYDIISRAFSRKKRWNELPHGLDLRNSWNLLWTWSKIKIDISKLVVWQKCNHFSGAKNVSRKDFLKRNIERAQKMSQKAFQVFNISPVTFILPKEYVGFLECFSEFEDKEGKMNYWIMKPAAKSRGRGISLVNDLTQITYGEPIVVQRYIKNPLLINGYKFDMRIYVIVTSVNPLEVFLYKDGFGRFSTIPFSLDPTDKNNKYIHLTNVSIQKYNQSNSDQDQSDLLYGGTKISIATLKKRFMSATNVNWDEVIWPQIREVILKSLVACQNDIQYNPCSFELFGYDIMIDSDYKCWLIEINSSPSLARDTLLDDMIKQRLIDDTIDLVDPIDFDRKKLFEVLERRINEDFKQSTTTNQYSKRLMNRDLTYILNGQVPRKYGEMPKLMGNFERLAPSPLCDQYLKLIGGQKMFGTPESSYSVSQGPKFGQLIYIPRQKSTNEFIRCTTPKSPPKYHKQLASVDVSELRRVKYKSKSHVYSSFTEQDKDDYDVGLDFSQQSEGSYIKLSARGEENKGQYFSNNDTLKHTTNNDNKNKHPIPCLYLASSQGSTKLMLYFHRNAEDIGLAAEDLEHLKSFFRFHIIAMEYPGYGIYDGQSDAYQIQQDAETVYKYITQDLGIPEQQILIYGRSIGSGPAVYLAHKYKPCCLLLISGFKSIRDIAKEQAGKVLGSLVYDRFKNLELIDQVKCPTFFIHGQKDTLISFQHSKDLYYNCGGPSALITPKEMDHDHFDMIKDLIQPFYSFLKQVNIDTGIQKKDQEIPQFPKELFTVPKDFPRRIQAGGSFWNWVLKKFN